MTTLQTYGPGVGRFQNLSFVVGVVCLALCGVGAYADPEQFYRSYLVAYLYWIGLALGCVAVVMLHHLTGGRWGRCRSRLAGDERRESASEDRFHLAHGCLDRVKSNVVPLEELAGKVHVSPASG